MVLSSDILSHSSTRSHDFNYVYCKTISVLATFARQQTFICVACVRLNSLSPSNAMGYDMKP